MSSNIEHLRVFIASPTGLAKFRKSFNRIIGEFNSSHGEDLVRFEAVGWTDTPPGTGRTQELINRDIRTCDYLIMLLHDRWGTPTHANGIGPGFSAGCEEEYSVAMECLQDSSLPMTDVVVLFKRVLARDLKDPSDQLRHVLEFRKGLEKCNKQLCREISDLPKFEKLLRSLLHKWAADRKRAVESLEHKTSSNAPSLNIASYLEKPWETKIGPTDFLFLYSKRETELQGRARVILENDLPEFLGIPKQFSWWLWTGSEGVGKSRLAAEACLRAEKQGWNVGFINRRNQHPDWNEVRIDKPLFLVFDNASVQSDLIHSAFSSLMRRFSNEVSVTRRIRLLVVEQHPVELDPLEPSVQWLQDLFPQGTAIEETGRVLANQFPSSDSSSLHLGSLSRDDAVKLAIQALELAGQSSLERSEAASAKDAAEIIDNLNQDEWRPLHIQIMAHVSRKHGMRAVPSFEKGLARFVQDRVTRRIERLQRIKIADDDIARIINLICTATVLRDVAIDDLPDHPALPAKSMLRDEGVLIALGQHRDSNRIHGVSPHLIGFWFVALWAGGTTLGRGMKATDLADILTKCRNSTKAIAWFVSKTFRQFGGNDVWPLLRDCLGRYSTLFGSVFDDQLKQAQLLGGTSSEAEKRYHNLVVSNIERILKHRKRVNVLDLMAGGSKRPAEIAERFGARVRLLTIDRDVDRLRSIASQYDEIIIPIEAQISGDTRLRELIATQSSFMGQIDIVIAKKALHELPWVEQSRLIHECGKCVRAGGCFVLYADSPKYNDSHGREEWDLMKDALCKLLPIDLLRRDKSAIESRSREFFRNVEFDTSDLCAQSKFFNLWIKLKDWSNYNRREWERRYFSSIAELRECFDKAGFHVAESRGAEVSEFEMELQATRFVEDAINRLGYLCEDSSSTDEELSRVFSDNLRYAQFWKFTRSALWDDVLGLPTPFGQTVAARVPAPVDMSHVKSFLDEKIRLGGTSVKFDPLPCPSFRMPVHVCVFPKEGREQLQAG